MKAILYVDVVSHWCLVAMPAVTTLTEMGVDVELVYAPLKDGAPLGFTNEMESWFYKRGSRIYGRELICAWCEGPHVSSWAANAAAFAAGELLGDQPRAAHAIMSAAMEEGALVGRPEVAYERAAQSARTDAATIEALATSARVRERLLEGNKRLTALGADERPTWELRSDNGDFAILKGVWQRDAVAVTAAALLHDERGYAAAGKAPS